MCAFNANTQTNAYMCVLYMIFIRNERRAAENEKEWRKKNRMCEEPHVNILAQK